MSFRGLRYYTFKDYFRRACWAVVQPFWRCSPRWCWRFRCWLLRLFGAHIASGVYIYPAARIHQPWNLSIGPRSIIGWDAVLYCLGQISLGSDVVVSQGAHLCAGDHDIRDPRFPVLKTPLTIASGAWIAADAFIGPRVTIGERAVVGARAVVMRDVSASSVVAGNPARVVGQR